MRASLMQRTLLSGLALVVALVVVTGDAAAKKPWEKFNFPALGDISIPDYERHELSNGLVVFLLENSTWPLVEGQIIVRTGAAFEPADKVGLASVAGDVLRTGGTETIEADALDEELERMGAYIESGIGDTSGTMSFSFLSQTSNRGLDLVADVLRHPVFDQEKIDVALEGERAGVARRNDDLNSLVARELQQAVWGDDHPYARDTEYATLEAITRDDVIGFYEYFYHPDNMMIAVWGDFDKGQMLTKIQTLFGDWERGDVIVPEFPNEANEKQRKRVLVANKGDVNQSRVAMGHIGMRADDEDYYAMSVANRILGGGFGDRLFNEVRTNRGLAYNVGSTTGVGFATPGVFQAYVGTKSGTTEEAIGVILETIEGMRSEPVTEQELSDAKEGMLAANVFNYVSPRQVLQRKMNLEYLGYPDDFLERYNKSVRSVDADAVQSVMQRRVNPDDFAIVAVGKREDWDGDLTGFGPVEELDISIPEPAGPEFPEPTDESTEMGRAILAAAQNAHGGSKLSSLSSIVQEKKVTISAGGMSFPATAAEKIVFPDRSYTEFKIQFGDQIIVVNGDSGWTKSAQAGLTDMADEELATQRRDIISNPLFVLGNFDSFPVQQLDSEEIDGTVADVVLVWIDDEAGEWSKMYFDPGSHALLRTQGKGKNPMTGAPATHDMVFSNLKTVAGIEVPHTQTLLLDGEEFMTAELVSIEFNTKVDASIFEKPAS